MRAIRRKYCVRCIEFYLISLHTYVHVEIYLYTDNKILIQDSVSFFSKSPRQLQIQPTDFKYTSK